MRIEQINILIDDIYQVVDVVNYEMEDKSIFKEIYFKWINLNNSINDAGGKNLIFPFEIAEALCCIEFNMVKMNNNWRGFDCYDIQEERRVEVKVKTTEYDLSSFSPYPSFDDVYFMDFYRYGDWDGKFDVYIIPIEKLLEHKMNSRDSFKDHIFQGRRPKLSLSKFIKQYNIEPIKTGSVY